METEDCIELLNTLDINGYRKIATNKILKTKPTTIKKKKREEYSGINVSVVNVP